MSKNRLEIAVSIDTAPDEVIRFISDTGNRTKYQQSLTSISDVQGAPGEIGASWRWKWMLMDNEFQGVARCVEYEPGRRYAFVTEGGIASKFTYRAEPSGAGTSLTVEVEFDVPAALAGRDDMGQLLEVARQRGQESLARLKALLEK